MGVGRLLPSGRRRRRVPKVALPRLPTSPVWRLCLLLAALAPPSLALEPLLMLSRSEPAPSSDSGSASVSLPSLRTIPAPLRHVTLRSLTPFRQPPSHSSDLDVNRNAPVATLYEHAIRNEGAVISSSGALINFSGKKTGRSPKDKRIVYEETSKDDVWWGPVNIKMDEHTFEINRERAIDYLNTRENVYVFDGFAGADPKYRIKVRVIASRAYHALFMVRFSLAGSPGPTKSSDFRPPPFAAFLCRTTCSSDRPRRSSRTLASLTSPS